MCCIALAAWDQIVASLAWNCCVYAKGNVLQHNSGGMAVPRLAPDGAAGRQQTTADLGWLADHSRPHLLISILLGCICKHCTKQSFEVQVQSTIISHLYTLSPAYKTETSRLWNEDCL